MKIHPFQSLVVQRGVFDRGLRRVHNACRIFKIGNKRMRQCFVGAKVEIKLPMPVVDPKRGDVALAVFHFAPERGLVGTGADTDKVAHL